MQSDFVLMLSFVRCAYARSGTAKFSNHLRGCLKYLNALLPIVARPLLSFELQGYAPFCRLINIDLVFMSHEEY